MRNLGIFLPMAVTTAEVAELGLSLGGRPMGDETQLFGEPPSAVYLNPETALSNGCFDEEEYAQLAHQLGFVPAAYISIHMGSTSAAFQHALSVAHAIQERWGGSIDYSGAGGRVEEPFEPVCG